MVDLGLKILNEIKGSPYSTGAFVTWLFTKIAKYINEYESFAANLLTYVVLITAIVKLYQICFPKKTGGIKNG